MHSEALWEEYFPALLVQLVQEIWLVQRGSPVDADGAICQPLYILVEGPTERLHEAFTQRIPDDEDATVPQPSDGFRQCQQVALDQETVQFGCRCGAVRVRCSIQCTAHITISDDALTRLSEGRSSCCDLTGLVLNAFRTGAEPRPPRALLASGCCPWLLLITRAHAISTTGSDATRRFSKALAAPRTRLGGELSDDVDGHGDGYGAAYAEEQEQATRCAYIMSHEDCVGRSSRKFAEMQNPRRLLILLLFENNTF